MAAQKQGGRSLGHGKVITKRKPYKARGKQGRPEGGKQAAVITRAIGISNRISNLCLWL